MKPDRWSMRRVRSFARRHKRVNVEGLELEPLSVTKDRGVILQSEKYNKRIATDLRKYLIVEPGQFAFDPMSLYYGSIGQVRAKDYGVISPDYVAFSVDQSVSGRYLNYLLRSPSMIRQYEVLAEGGNLFGKRRRVYWSIFENIDLVLPPLPEQRKIAAILSSVDETIEATQAVIDQLLVVKKAMMEELLTRGIPGRHKRFKQTELGEVPEEWEVIRLEQAGILQTGLAMGKSWNNRHSVTLPYLRVANVQDGQVDTADLRSIEVGLDAVERYSLKQGDVLFTEGGDADKLGRGCVWDGHIGPCLHQNHVFAFRPDTSVLLPTFLAFYAASPRGRSYFLGYAKQTTNLASINSSQLKALPVPLASIEEQKEISRALESLDIRIRAERETLPVLIAVKSSLLSVLLSGEVRVNVAEEAAAEAMP